MGKTAAIGRDDRYVWLVLIEREPIQSVAWGPEGKSLVILDQTALPERELFLDVTSLDDIVEAIRELRVRGAPAIGVAAAIGLAVTLTHDSAGSPAAARALLPHHAARLIASRPTAVNLAWAVNRMVRAANDAHDVDFFAKLNAEAERIRVEDVAMCHAIGLSGLPLLHDGARVLTHCNAGALATAGIGTALAPVYLAHAQGMRVHVFANETRPLRQGARLTAWELARAGIDVTLLPDSAAASLLRDKRIDLVIVGADRIAANGDVANKIGTYPLALAARAHGVPFYVAAPGSTFDFETATGAEIHIEQRSGAELNPVPAGVKVYNPAFDVTPASLIAAYITNVGLLHAPFTSEFISSLHSSVHGASA